MKLIDCNRRSAASWSGTLAALVSRGAAADDPRVIEARQSISYLRAKRALVAERPIWTTDMIDQLAQEITA